jgi:AcrR family transcriptional regulator
MPVDASSTREKLIDEAARAFAADGVFAASLIDITRKAGQRNRGALHYHFGSRTGVLCAVLERHAEFLARREGELLEKARAAPDDDVRAVVEAIVRPATELAELVDEDPASLDPDVSNALAHTGGYDVYALLATRMADVGPDIRAERFALATAFILRAVADRARVLGRRGRGGRPQLEHETFVENLVAMVAAGMSAPQPDR